MREKIVLVEPLVKYPIKVQKNGKKADIGVRLNLAYLAGYIIDNSRNFDAEIKPYRFEEFLGKERNLEKDFDNASYVGISASSSEFPDALRMAKAAKDSGAKVIMGGIYPSANPESALSSGVVDYVVHGEGEVTLLDLLQHIQSKQDVKTVKGISYLNDGKIQKNPNRPLMDNIDSLRPAYELLPMQEYAKYVSGSIYSGRGCYGKCNFCTVSKHWQHTYRTRSIDNITDEVKLLKSYGFDKVNFKDESITLDPNHALGLAAALKKTGMQFKGKTRLDGIDYQLASTLKEAGFYELHFGVESVNEEGLTEIDKSISKDLIYKQIDMLKSLDFTLNPSIILGIPGDTEKSLQELTEFVKFVYSPGKTKVYTCLNTPHPTETSKRNLEGITIINHNLERYTHFHLVSVPKSMGNTREAIQTISEFQKQIVEYVDGPEPLISTYM